MMSSFHFIRPLWLFALLPLLVQFIRLFSQKPSMDGWLTACDAHLLPYLVHASGKSSRVMSLLVLLISLIFMVFSLAGPSWTRLPVPTYHKVEPRIVVLDLSDPMLLKDISPSRLSRAKFKLHDLFQERDAGQFGMVAYTSEPFVVSPMTDDGETIDALLSSLTPDMMPVKGNRLDLALLEAAKLIHHAGFNQGEILVLTATTPSAAAIATAAKLAKKGMDTSVIPVTEEKSSMFQRLAHAGHGEQINLTESTSDLKQWLHTTHAQHALDEQGKHDIPMWRDEGRWFLIPSLLLLLPVFRRGWLQRMNS